MPVDERDVVTEGRLARIETQYTMLSLNIQEIRQAQSRMEAKMNWFSGGVALLGGVVGLFANQLWDKFFR